MITSILGFLLLLLLATATVVALHCLLCAREVRNPPRCSTGWAIARSRPTDPEAIDPDHRQWHLEPGDGSCLPVWEATTGGTVEASSPVVVVIHGWGHSHTHSIELVEAVIEAARDHGGLPPSRLVFPDLRGHGDASPGPTTLGERELGDLEAIIETYASPAPVFLVGHSLGAVLAIRIAVRQPDRVRGVLALAPYRRVTTPVAATLSARGLPGGRLAGPVARLSTSPAVLATDTAAEAGRMTQPLEVLVGSEDRICPPTDARAIADRARTSRLEVVAGPGHGELHREAGPALAAALARLLRDSTGPDRD